MLLEQKSLDQIAQILDQKLDEKLNLKPGETFDQKLDRKFDKKLNLKPDETFDQKLGRKFDEKLSLKPGETFDQKLDCKFDKKLNLQPGETFDQKLDRKFRENTDELQTHIQLSFAHMEQSIARLDGRLSRTEHDTRDIKLDLENLVHPRLNLLAEVYVPKAREFEKASTEIKELKASVDVLNLTVTRHSKLLNKANFS